MPKYILATLIFVLTFCASAQIPSGYYNTASGTGFTLKTQIHYIIDNHNERTYNDVWDFISDYELDTYFENDGTILDIYSENPSGTDSYNFIKISNQCGSNGSVEGDCYNREHSFPKSWFYDGYPMYTDIHHLFPTDKIVNGQRSNYPYGEVSSATFTSQNGSKVGSGRSGLGYSGIVFEPIAEFKGDLARAYFYMATRYEDVVNNWSSDMLDGSSDQVFETWALDMLMTWHVNDPVSPKETDRNNNAYNFQGNRNPFVDHPEWVDEIWGYGSANSPLITVTAPSNGLDFGQVGAGNSSASQSYTLSGSNLLGDILISLSAPFELSQDNSTWSNQMTITQANAEAGANNIYVRFSPISDNNQTYNTSILHTSANAVNIAFAVQGTEKTALSSSEDDLFISEYIEGSSNNKALEIFNGTGSAIDMAAEQYSIIRYNNGSETPDMNNGTLNLIGIVNNGGVYVIANPSSSQAILDISNLTSEITFYNGDDAVGLYKNGVLVDLIGVIGADPGTNWNDGNHFTSEKTLVRKANINKGNPNGFSDISLLSSEWDVFDQNTISNLGSHTFSPEPITYQWLGTSDQVWTTSANWQNNNLPSSNSNITVSNGSSYN
jgi:endonuclease I